MSACPFCKGTGRVFPANREAWPEGWSCDNCSATGDYDTMRLIRAYWLGRKFERARAVAHFSGVESTELELGFHTIQAAVVDDVRRQRIEEMLEPGSATLTRLEGEVKRLLREREPLLKSLNALSVELLRAELAA